MAALADLLRTRHDEIVRHWARNARRAAAARGLGVPELENIMPKYLYALADAGEELGRFTGKRREHVENHLASRLRHGFEVAEIVEEFALLGRCIAAAWSGGDAPPPHEEIERLFAELHRASVAVTDMFAAHMMQDEQAEKRYLRLIQQVAQEALAKDGPALRARLREVLALVMEAMGAQSAAILLVRPGTGALEIAASVGAADEMLEDYVTSVGAASFAGEVSRHEETTEEHDAATTTLDVSDALRRSGIHSLLGLRLPPLHDLVGVLYVGLTATRAFTARGVRRLEALGSELALHLDNARLYAELRDRIAALDAERDLRERFVSVLAHDLRGPLSAARLSAQLLVRHPDRLDDRRDLALRIDRSLEQTDRMVRDLLDANRIRAGERLPLRLDDCNLGSIAREVYEQAVAVYGERFVLDAEPRVVGVWSAEELRRALWNLVANAVKYGREREIVTLTVKRTPGGACASVHNVGNPLSPEDREALFRPYARGRGAEGREGWGLGLTLVLGCAEAHGGRVAIESSAEGGTTFSIELPIDARAALARAA
jgi:signal transduction histidine kinase